MTTDISEKTTKSMLIQLEGNLEWTLKQSQNEGNGFIRVERSQDQWNLGKGQRAPIGGCQGYTLILHLRLGRNRIKILMATSHRYVGREKKVDSGKSSLKGRGRETARGNISPAFSHLEEEIDLCKPGRQHKGSFPGHTGGETGREGSWVGAGRWEYPRPSPNPSPLPSLAEDPSHGDLTSPQSHTFGKKGCNYQSLVWASLGSRMEQGGLLGQCVSN